MPELQASLNERQGSPELEGGTDSVRATEHPHQACPCLGFGSSGHREYQMEKPDLLGLSKPFSDDMILKDVF